MKFIKERIYDELLGDYIVRDERIFSDCVEFELKRIRNHAKELILAAVPEYKQRNAALGLLSDAEITEIKNNIQTIRNISNEKENDITSVVWNGTEETRAAACDAVQAVRWE